MNAKKLESVGKGYFKAACFFAELVVYERFKTFMQVSLTLHGEVSDSSPTPVCLLNVAFYPLQTNYIRETQTTIFWRAHFSHCPCQ